MELLNKIIDQWIFIIIDSKFDSFMKEIVSDLNQFKSCFWFRRAIHCCKLPIFSIVTLQTPNEFSTVPLIMNNVSQFNKSPNSLNFFGNITHSYMSDSSSKVKNCMASDWLVLVSFLVIHTPNKYMDSPT